MYCPGCRTHRAAVMATCQHRLDRWAHLLQGAIVLKAAVQMQAIANVVRAQAARCLNQWRALRLLQGSAACWRRTHQTGPPQGRRPVTQGVQRCCCSLPLP